MAEPPAVGDVIKSITEDVKSLVRDEVALAKAELVPSAKNAGIGAGMFAGAGYFALHALGLFYVAGALGIAAGFDLPYWAGFLIMGGVLFLIAGILALIGRAKLKKIKGPEQTVEQANKTVAEVKGAVDHAKAAATAPTVDGKIIENPVVEKRALAQR